MGYVNIFGTPKGMVFLSVALETLPLSSPGKQFWAKNLFKQRQGRDFGEAEERVDDVHHRGERGAGSGAERVGN